MIAETIKAKGTLSLVLTDEFGNIKSQQEENIVVAVGLAYIASRMKDATATVMSHMSIGTGATATALSQTALTTEIARVTLGSTTITTNQQANDSVTYAATFNPGVGTGSIQEAGIFNAASAGTMLARTQFGVITKGSLDTLTITWRVSIA